MRKTRYDAPALTGSVGVIEKITGREAAIRVAIEMGGLSIRLGESVADMTESENGRRLAELVAADKIAAVHRALYDYRKGYINNYGRVTIEHCKEARAIRLLEKGMSRENVAHELQLTQRSVSNYETTYRRSE